MERIKSKKDDLTQKMRPGTTWVAGFTRPGNNDDLRSIDSDGAEMRFIPNSRYYASGKIKRGQAVSIAQLSDLTEEQKQNKYAYVKITDPDLDETCIGIAMSCAEEGQIVHIQSFGKFNYSTTNSILYKVKASKEKEIFLNGEEWSFDNVRGQKLYVKKLYNNITTEGENTRDVVADENGDNYDTDHEDKSVAADNSDWFTYDFTDSIYNTKSTIQVGTLTDAPTTDLHFYFKENDTWVQKFSSGKTVPIYKDVVIVEYDEENDKIVTAEEITLTSTGLKIEKGSTPPKAHEAVWLQFVKTEEDVDYFAAVDDLTVTIELNITGDTRGPIDNTQFILTLGESIYFDTKKQNVKLKAPNYYEGIYDELKVVALASGKPSGPFFRFFLTANGEVAYKKAETFDEDEKYYGRYPGNVYKEAKYLTLNEFKNTYLAAVFWTADTEYFELDETTNTYKSLGKVDLNEFQSSTKTLYYKIDYYTAVNALEYAFIGLRKIDGDTYLIPVLCNFTEEDLADGSVLADANDEGYFRLSQQFTSGTKRDYFNKAESFDATETYFALNDSNEFEKVAEPVESDLEKYYTKETRSPKITIGEPLLDLTKANLEKAISDGLKSIFVDNETGKRSCNPIIYTLGDEGFSITTEEFGGSYDVYLSSNILGLISATQLKHGQSAEAGTAILADIRDADRLNVVGVVLSNNTGVRKIGETIKVMRMGRITTLGNVLPGQDYYLGLNGRITARQQYWYDHNVPIGTAESENYFLVDISQHPMHNYSGNFPLGYLKPSIYGMSEKGFVVADGTTRYKKEEYAEFYNLLLNWFDEEELKPSNVTEDKYNKYENWKLSQIFTDIFNELNSLIGIKSDLVATQKLKDQIQQNANSIASLQEENQEQANRLTSLETEAASQGTRLSNVESENASQEETISELKSQTSELSNETEDLAKKNAEQDVAIAAAEETADIEALRESTALDLQNNAETLTAYIQELDNKLDTANQLNKELREALDAAVARISTIETENEDRDANIAAAEESKEITEAVDGANTTFEAKLAEATSAFEEKLAIANEANVNLQNQLDEANSTITSLTDKLSTLENAIAEIKTSIENSKEIIDAEIVESSKENIVAKIAEN